jgi:thymidine kinase
MSVIDNGGDLQLILGTMFSGKTTYLLNEIAKMAEINYKVLYINIGFDSRCTNNTVFSTHNPYLVESHHKNVQMIKVNSLLDIDFEPFDVIVIDESHFFEDLINFVHRLLFHHKTVLVAGLIADSNGNKFGKTLDLVPVCTNIIRLKAYCYECAKSKKCSIAAYSCRTTTENKSFIIDIGGADKYVPLCRTHFFEYK